MRVLRTIIGIGIVLLTVGAVAALWGYFEWFAPIVAGKVVDKQERIAGSRVHSAPGRYLSTSFKLKDETEQDRYIYGSPHVTDINVDQQTYRRLPAGAAVTVKYLPINPAMARLEGQPLVPPTFWKFIAAILLVITSLFLTRTRMAVVLCTALAVALLVTVPGPPSSQFALTASVTTAVLAVLAATLKRGTPAHILAVWVVMMAGTEAWSIVQAAKSDDVSATAEVRTVSWFQASTTSRRRAEVRLQAFDRVHAVLLPADAKEPVYFLDFVDHGTVAGLKEGSKVAVEYKPGAPDAARLVDGSRSHYWKNAVIPIGAVIALAWLTGHRGLCGGLFSTN
jgi:hypothetical protein